MRELTYVHNDASEAKLRICLEDDRVYVSCDWPIDRSTDEWFKFQLDVSLGQYSAAIEACRSSGVGAIEGDLGRKLVFSKGKGGSYVDVELSKNSALGETRLYLRDVFAAAEL